MEAIIGATFLAQGMEAATQLVLAVLGAKLATAPSDGADHKSRLQELSAHLFGQPPRYEVEATGPDGAAVPFAAEWRARPERTQYVPVRIDRSDPAHPVAEPVERGTRGFGDANGLAVIPPSARATAAGDEVEVLRW